MTVPAAARWTLLAILGLAVAAGVSFAASHVVSQRIGLSSEPLSAGRELAPPASTQEPKRKGGEGDHRHRHGGGGSAATTTTTVPTVPPVTTTAPAPAPVAPTTTNGGSVAEAEAGDD